jgi:DNA polymerase III sliding clamp (beta) subunit (PCNA family)
MKCTALAGELRDALLIASATIDRRGGSDLGYLYLGAKKYRNGDTMLLHTTDSLNRSVVKTPCVCEENGELVVEPGRLLALLEKRDDAEIVTFSRDAGNSSRVHVKVGSARGILASAFGQLKSYTPDMALFPFKKEPLFQILPQNLKQLIERVSGFIFTDDGEDSFKSLLIRTTPTGYESLATNYVVAARAQVEDPHAPVLPEGAAPLSIEIPGNARQSLMKLLSRRKTDVIDVVTTDNMLFFRTKDAMYGTALSTSSKLQAADVVFRENEMEIEAEVPRAAMLDTILRSNPFAQNTTSGYRLINVHLQGRVVRLKANDVGGEFVEEIAVETDIGGEQNANFNAGYLSEILRHAPEDNFTMKFGTAGPKHVRVGMILCGGTNGASYIIGAVPV